MFDLREYAITSRGRCWPSGECLVLDLSSGTSVAIVREEPWAEVLVRQWPDGVKGRPWLSRLLGVGRNPKQSRTVIRRYDDGWPIVRLHHRQPILHHTMGLFDHDDQRVGYVRWPFKSPRGDEFDIVQVDHQRIATVRRTAAGAYRMSAEPNDLEWGIITVSRSGISPQQVATSHVALQETALRHEHGGMLLLVAALMLIQWDRRTGEPDAVSEDELGRLTVKGIDGIAID